MIPLLAPVEKSPSLGATRAAVHVILLLAATIYKIAGTWQKRQLRRPAFLHIIGHCLERQLHRTTRSGSEQFFLPPFEFGPIERLRLRADGRLQLSIFSHEEPVLESLFSRARRLGLIPEPATARWLPLPASFRRTRYCADPATPLPVRVPENARPSVSGKPRRRQASIPGLHDFPLVGSPTAPTPAPDERPLTGQSPASQRMVGKWREGSRRRFLSGSVVPARIMCR